jgi:hypothetical protein
VLLWPAQLSDVSDAFLDENEASLAPRCVLVSVESSVHRSQAQQ